MMIERANELLKAISTNKDLSQQLKSGNYSALQELDLNFEQIYASIDSGIAFDCGSAGCGVTVNDLTLDEFVCTGSCGVSVVPTNDDIRRE